MDQHTLRKNRGWNVQDFRKKTLILAIPFYTQEIRLKYIAGLHISYLRHIILMFNPTNIYEVCVKRHSY